MLYVAAAIHDLSFLEGRDMSGHKSGSLTQFGFVLTEAMEYYYKRCCRDLVLLFSLPVKLCHRKSQPKRIFANDLQRKTIVV